MTDRSDDRTGYERLRDHLATGSSIHDAASGALSGGTDWLVWRRDEIQNAQLQVLDEWAPDFDRLELVVAACVELGHEFLDRHWHDAYEADDLKVRALWWLWKVSITVADEALVLMKSGYAVGALTRWRTLHEIEVAARVLSDGDRELARRYARHEELRWLRDTVRDHRLRKEEGRERLPSDEIRASQARVSETMAEFGEVFAGDFGWAHEAVLERSAEYRRRQKRGERPRGPTFADLQACAGLRTLAVEYSWASSGTHASTLARQRLMGEDSEPFWMGISPRGIHLAGNAVAQSVTNPIRCLVASFPEPRDDELAAVGELVAEMGLSSADAFRDRGWVEHPPD